MIPVYSNVYYDFHPEVLRNYHITQSITWSEAIVGSYFSDVPEGEETKAEEEDSEAVSEALHRMVRKTNLLTE